MLLRKEVWILSQHSDDGYKNVAGFEQEHGVQLPEDIGSLLTSQAESNDANIYNARGITHSGNGEYDQAIAAFTKAIELDPDHSIAYYNRGLAYRIKEDYKRAIADYTKAIEIDPHNADAYYRRSRAWLHLGEEEKAKSDMKTASDIGINNTTAIDEILRDYDHAWKTLGNL